MTRMKSARFLELWCMKQRKEVIMKRNKWLINISTIKFFANCSTFYLALE